MRIALTHAFCWPEVRRGAERFVPGLGAALARRGHEVTHFSSAWEPASGSVDGVEMVQIRRRHQDVERQEADFGMRVARHLAARPFDAVHSLGRHDALASMRAARLRRSRRTVFTDLGLPTRAYWSSRRRRDARAVEKVVAGIEVYSCMSRCGLEHLEREYGRSDGVVVPGGVSVGHFVPAAARAPKPTMLFSGALEGSHKELPLLLAALPIVARSEPDVELWLSGPGDADQVISQASAEALPRIRALSLGEVGRQHERYGQAWLTCLPSRYDSFGMVLVESLACGTPIVTTTQGAPQELVDPGVTGELCAPGDPEDLARACVRALALARLHGTVEACRRSARDYDWDARLAPLCERLYAG